MGWLEIYIVVSYLVTPYLIYLTLIKEEYFITVGDVVMFVFFWALSPLIAWVLFILVIVDKSSAWFNIVLWKRKD